LKNDLPEREALRIESLLFMSRNFKSGGKPPFLTFELIKLRGKLSNSNGSEVWKRGLSPLFLFSELDISSPECCPQLDNFLSISVF
jgi:hypothetical protein